MLIFCFSSKTVLNFPSMGEHCIGNFSIGMVLSPPHYQVLHLVAQPCTDDRATTGTHQLGIVGSGSKSNIRAECDI